MEQKTGLDTAYALAGSDDVKALYRGWADTYDTAFAEARGYRLPQLVADAFVALGGKGPVLDVGAGTGLVGAALSERGIGPLDGTDISTEMLQVAQRKGCYKSVFTSDITALLRGEDGLALKERYAGIVSAGTFTLGHLGPAPLEHLVDLLVPGGLCVVSVNAQHWNAAGFAQVLECLGPRLADIQRKSVRIYAEGASHDHAGDEGYVLSFRRNS